MVESFHIQKIAAQMEVLHQSLLYGNQTGYREHDCQTQFGYKIYDFISPTNKLFSGKRYIFKMSIFKHHLFVNGGSKLFSIHL